MIIYVDFMIRALIAGVGIAIIAAPLGCLMVWRNMAYFSDTLSHAALLGIALGVFFSINLTAGVFATALLIAWLLWRFNQTSSHSNSNLLTILTQSSLALGLLTISFLPSVQIDLMSYLMGDILSISHQELLIIYTGGILILTGIGLCWRNLISITLHEELSRVEGIPVNKLHGLLMIMMALFVAIALQMIGVLLLSALLIIPASTARAYSKSPLQMVLLASVFGSVSVILGILLSSEIDLPTGPAIVAVSTFFFGVSLGGKQK